MINDIQLLKSVSQYIDMKGNIYELDNNGNIDDMSIPSIGNIVSAPQSWWNHLSNYDIRIADIIYGGLVEKEMYG
jgi:hypothetical protein